MSAYRTEEEVRHYDLFKGVILTLLFAGLVIAIGASGSGTAEVAEGESAPVEEVELPEEIAAESPAAEITAPELFSPAPGDELAAGPVTFSGMGTPGTQVAIIAGGQELGRTAVGDNGTWEVEVVLPPDAGDVELQAIDSSGQVVASSPTIPMTVVDPDTLGGESGSDETGAGETEEIPFTVDQLPPDTTAGTITVSGTGQPNSEVAVDIDGVQVAVTTIGEDGVWSVEIDAGQDAVEVSARQASSAGEDVVTISAGQIIAVPAVPPSIDFPESELSEGEVTITGTGEPGDSLRLLANGVNIGTVLVAEDGTWSLETILPADDYELDVVTLDEDGNAVETIPALSMTILPLEPPTFALSDLALPEFNPLTGSLAFDGQSEPGARVAAIVDGEVISEATADAEGTWNQNISLAPGLYALAFGLLNSSGEVAAVSDDVAIEVPGRLPQINLPEFSLPDNVLAELTRPGPSPAEGAAPEDNADTAEEDTDQPPAVRIPNLDKIEIPSIKLPAGPLELAGSADPGTEVAFVIDGQVVGTATADENAEFTLSGDVASGASSLQVGVVGEDGALIGQSKSITISVSDMTVPTVEQPELTGDESTVTISGTADPDSTVQITANGEPIGETTADADGNWSFEVGPLPAEAMVRVQALNEAGQPALFSNRVTLPGDEQTIAELPAEDEDEVTDSDAGEAEDVDEDVDEGETEDTDEGDAEDTDEADAEDVDEAEAEDGDEGETEDTDEGDAEDTDEGDAEDVDEAEAEDGDEATAGVADADADTLVGALEDADSFEILLSGLEAAGLTQSLDEIDESFTMFAPTDEAFAAIPPDLLLGWQFNPEEYRNLLSYLVVEGKFTPEDLTDGLVLETVAGTNVGITHVGEMIQISGVPVIDSADVGNSIVYAIPKVILPPLPPDTVPPIIDESGVPVFTGPTLTVVGTGEPGERILLTVDGESFGDIVFVQPDGTWQIVDEIESNVRFLVGYMIDAAGILRAMSQQVELPVP